MNKTAIEWCDMTWNPVTGCLHDCPYCYAARIARRFGEKYVTTVPAMPHIKRVHNGKCYELTEACKTSYPFGFSPTLHRYRLDEPLRIKKPQNIFVCSMADLFGEWVPDEWIKAVFEACAKAPWHRYLFLTKNPKGAWRDGVPILKGAWYGATITRNADLERISRLILNGNRYISIEPILEPINLSARPVKTAIPFADWVIIGAETGSKKSKVIPKREWIESIVKECREQEIPVFMKDSLRGIWKEPLVQEYPWENEKLERYYG